MRPGDSLAIVGDIHGDAERLYRALALLIPRDLHVVFVGDYVNRGLDSRSVLEQLLQARATAGDRLTLLRGNHDQTLLDFLEDGDAAQLVAHGGTATVRSYLQQGQGDLDAFRSTFPAEHLNLLRSTSDYYETDDLLVTHAGFNPTDVLSRRPQDIRGVGFRALFEHSGPWPRPLTICGHYVQRQGRPYTSAHLICLDTGCGTVENAPLTLMYWPSITTESIE